MTQIYNKLVRDRIPEIIEADGLKPITRKLNKKQLLTEAIQKIGEEAKELAQNPSAEELADIEELVIAIRDELGIKAKDLEKVRKQKAKERGGFKKRIFLERVEE